MLRDISAYTDIPALLKKCQRINFITEGARTYAMSCAQKAFARNKPLALIDVAFPIVHGTNVEDGALQGFLQTLNLPFVGCDVRASALCMDKYDSKILLQQGGFPVLPGRRFTAADYDDPQKICAAIEDTFQYPLIVKPINLGSSIGIGKAHNTGELEEALATAFSFADRVVVEPAVANLREINCAVLGDADEAVASECEEPCLSAEILSYSDKYLGNSKTKQSGGKGMAGLKRKIPAEISPDLREKIRTTAVAAFRYLDCNGVARIDFLLDGETGDFWLNELNTIPGSLSFYLWEPTGLSYPELLDKMISLALKRQRKRDDLIFTFDTNILASGVALGGKK
jgi:D-alanine-D-alanine ligase